MTDSVIILPFLCRFKHKMLRLFFFFSEDAIPSNEKYFHIAYAIVTEAVILQTVNLSQS